MRVEWLHNYREDSSSGSFMWDIHERLATLDELDLVITAIPLIRSLRDLSRVLNAGPTANDARLLHGQFGSFVGLLTGLKRAERRIISLRGSDSYWRYGGLRDRAGGILRVTMSWLGSLRCNAIVVMSRAQAARVQSWPFLRRRPIHVLVDPAGEIFWPEKARNIAPALQAHNFTVLIASLAQSNPVKRLDIVADAIRLCSDLGMNVHLKVMTGLPRDAVRDAIKNADSIALASTHEGWPNIVKEALLLGRPFVATAVSDLAELAGPHSANHVVAAHPLDFALAWVDQIAGKVLEPFGIQPALAQFHPDVCALKHALLYHFHGNASA